VTGRLTGANERVVAQARELAVAASWGGDKAGAEAFYFDASLASGDVYPLGSPESQALGVLLSSVAPMVTGAAA
jgi:hypothetical protein